MNATATIRGMRQRPDGGHRTEPLRRGFSLLDVMVSISVIAVLIGLLLPSFAKVNETARRMVCQSNIRQIGLGVVMYADDYDGYLPPSQFLSLGPQPRSGDGKQNMDTLRVSPDRDVNVPWDGLGLLYQYGYLSAPKVFYCPSHHGDNPYLAYALAWNEGVGEVICNYHYRGEGPRRPGQGIQNRLYFIDPSHSSLIADGLRTRSDFNHKVGVNFFTADLSVHWYDDADRALLLSLPETKAEAQSQQPVDDAWTRFDQSLADPN